MQHVTCLAHPQKDGTYLLWLQNEYGMSPMIVARKLNGKYYDLGVQRDMPLTDIIPSFNENDIVAHMKTSTFSPGVQTMFRLEHENRHGKTA